MSISTSFLRYRALRFFGMFFFVVYCAFFSGEAHALQVYPDVPLDQPEYPAGQLLIKLTSLPVAIQGASKMSFGAHSLDRLISEFHISSVQPIASTSVLKDVYLVTFDPSVDVKTAEKKFEKDPAVEYAEPNYFVKAAFTPNDQYFNLQWHFHNTASTNSDINLPAAWDYDAASPLYGGDSSVVVAVVDTGLAYEQYTDSQYTYAKAPDFAATNFTTGYDFVNRDTHPNDDNGHGTHVAGTIAESTNNTTGVAGIAFHATLMPVKVLDGDGAGTMANVAAGIDFARKNGADIINMSLEGPHSSTLQTAVKAAAQAGVIMVAANGNSGANGISYPAAYDEVISVGATRYDAALSYFSNYGTGMDLVAPGGDIRVDQNNDGYADGVLQQTIIMDNPNTQADETDPTQFDYYFIQGTSQATPHVAGAAALLLSYGVPAHNVGTILESTAQDLGATGYDTTFGYGLLDVAAALSSVAVDKTPPSGSVLLDNGNDSTTSNLVTLSLQAVDTGGSGISQMAFSNDGVKFSSYANYVPSFANWDITNTIYGGDSNKGAKKVYVKFRDAAFNESTLFSDSITFYGVKPFAPSSVSGYTASDKTNGLFSETFYSHTTPFFEWTTTEDPASISGYYVYFGTNSQADPFTDGSLQSENFFTSPSIEGNRKLYYLRIRSKNIGGSLSDDSTTYIYRLDNQAEPPSTFSSQSAKDALVILWKASPDIAYQGVSYTISRSRKETTDFSVIAQGIVHENGPFPSYRDTAAYPNILYYYKIFAVDDLGNTSLEMASGPTVRLSSSEIITAPASGQPMIRIWNQSGVRKHEFSADAKKLPSAVSVATGDTNGDGKSEIIIGARTGERSWIRIFSPNGKVVHQFFPFGKKFMGGITVASGDVNGDGVYEILAVPHVKHPRIYVFDARGRTVAAGFFPLASQGLFSVAARDLDGDAVDEIIVGSPPGRSPSAKVFTMSGTSKGKNFVPYGKNFLGGVNVSAFDPDLLSPGADILVATTSKGVHVRTFSLQGKPLTPQFFPYPQTFRTGIYLATGDLNADGGEEIVASQGAGGGRVRIFNEKATPILANTFYPYGRNFFDGVVVAVGDIE